VKSSTESDGLNGFRERQVAEQVIPMTSALDTETVFSRSFHGEERAVGINDLNFDAFSFQVGAQWRRPKKGSTSEGPEKFMRGSSVEPSSRSRSEL